jgi:tetratricopeptide (TPR) repeat protein
MAGMADTGISALLIDRSPEMRSNLRAMLGQCGIEDVQPAANAAAAIRQLGERAFDLILCEYALGEGQDGQHLLEDLRTHHVIPLSTLFIMVTAESNYERVVSAVEFAPNDYLLKPFTADSLFQRIGRALEKRDAFMPAYDLIEIGNLQAAAERCREGESLAPQYVIDFMRLRAELLVALGQADEAQIIYRHALESKAVPWAKLGLARTLYMQERYAEAEDDLQQLVKDNRQYVDAYDWLARTREAAGRLKEAQQALEAAVSVSPHTLRRLMKLGDIAFETGDMATAEKALSEVVRKGKYSDFRNPEHHVKLVKVFVAKGNRMQAEKTIRDLDRSMQGMEQTEACSALSSAIVLSRAGEKDQALAALNRAVAASRTNAALSDDLKIDLVKSCLEHQLHDAAAEMISEVMRNAADDRALARAKGVLEEAGLQSMADELALKTRQDVLDLVATGAMHAESGDFEGAVDFMLQAVRKTPGNTQVGMNAALTLLKLIEHRGWNEKFAAQARSLVDRARHSDPSNPRLASLTAYFQNMLSKYGIQPGRS